LQAHEDDVEEVFGGPHLSKFLMAETIALEIALSPALRTLPHEDAGEGDAVQFAPARRAALGEGARMRERAHFV